VDRDLQALRRELARFERRVRAMSLLGLAAAVIAAVLIVGARQAQSQQAALSARTVTVVDNNGRPRIVLGSDTNDRPGIWLRDDAGKDRLYFGFGTPGKPQFALLSFLWTWTGADAASYGGVQLFTIQNGWLTVVQQIFYTARHAGAGATFDPATGALFVNSSRYTQLDAHCCPSQQDVIRYAWTGHEFRQVAMKTFPLPQPGKLRIQKPSAKPN